MKLDYVTVGSIVNTHGVRGEVRVISKTEIPEKRFAPESELRLCNQDKQLLERVKVESSRPHKQFWLVKFEDIQGLHEAEKLKGLDLCVHVSDLPALDPGAYYIHELIGLKVVTDEGEDLGVVREVLTPGANDVYVVSQAGKKDLLLPAIKDCILEVNLDLSEMRVHLLPGLREANE